MTAARALDAVGRRPAFGFNFDPSHLQWQGVERADVADRAGRPAGERFDEALGLSRS